MANTKTIKGESEKTAPEQAKEVRKSKVKEPKDKRNADEQSAMKAARTPQNKADDVKFENRAKRMEEAGINPYSAGDSGSGWKTGKKVAGHKTYVGDLTLSGVSQSGHEISCRVHENSPRTEEELFKIFTDHHDSAVRDGFKIDPDNKSDPMLQTPFG